MSELYGAALQQIDRLGESAMAPGREVALLGAEQKGLDHYFLAEPGRSGRSAPGSQPPVPPRVLAPAPGPGAASFEYRSLVNVAIGEAFARGQPDQALAFCRPLWSRCGRARRLTWGSLIADAPPGQSSYWVDYVRALVSLRQREASAAPHRPNNWETGCKPSTP